MSGWRAWFDARSLREKRLLLIMAALALLALVWGAVIRPIGDGLASAHERADDAFARAGATQARVEAVHGALARHRGDDATPLVDRIRTAAEAAGLTLAALDPQGAGRVRVGIQSARGAAIDAWLARLEALGVIVDQATLTDNGDRTLGVDLTLRTQGR